jgi:hypothetical protein
MTVDDESKLRIVSARRQPAEQRIDLLGEAAQFQPLPGRRALREQACGL